MKMRKYRWLIVLFILVFACAVALGKFSFKTEQQLRIQQDKIKKQELKVLHEKQEQAEKKRLLEQKLLTNAKNLLTEYEKNPVSADKMADTLSALPKSEERTKLQAKFAEVMSVSNWTALVETDAAQIILSANAAANNGQANFYRSTVSKEIEDARTECLYNNSISEKGVLRQAHNYIPNPGMQNIAAENGQTYLFTKAGAKQLAEDLTNSYLAEKTGYDALIKAGYTTAQIQYDDAKVTVGKITYSFKGMDGSGFEHSADGGVVGHYLALVNQNPAQRMNRFSVGIYYNIAHEQAFETVDFYLPQTTKVDSWH